MQAAVLTIIGLRTFVHLNRHADLVACKYRCQMGFGAGQYAGYADGEHRLPRFSQLAESSW